MPSSRRVALRACALLVAHCLVLLSGGGFAGAQDAVRAAGLIAYIGVDGNVWLVNSDGSNPQQITDDANIPGYGSYANPSWSHDGSMLAFEGPALGGGSAIYVWTAGDPGRVEVESTEHCVNPVFSGDNQRVLYQCHRSMDGPPTSPLDPRNGEIVSSAIDGSDQRIEVEISPEAVQWTLAAGIDVRSSDGAVMVWSFDPYGIPRTADVRIYDAAFNEVSSALLPIGTNVGPAAVGPIDLAFSPGGEGFIALVCTATCIETGTAEAFAGVVTDLDGNIVERWDAGAPLDPSTLYYLTSIDMSPDGARMVASYADLHGAIGTFDASGAWTPIAEGHAAAWQPSVSVEAADEAAGSSPIVSAPPESESETATEPEAGSGWIAYVVEGEVRLVRPDLSEAVTVFETAGGSNMNPVWSHDGTMLAWNGPTWPEPAFLPNRGIWVYANGQVTQLPGTELCSQPAFSGDNSRIYYVCAGPEHQEHPVEAIIPDYLLDVPGTAVYVPNNTWLGSIGSSAIDGSDQRVELAYDGSDDPTWGGLSGEMMVYKFEIRPNDGALMVLYRNPVAPPTVAGTLVLDANHSLLSNTPLAEGDIFPLMLPDGTIVTPRPCENLCPNGMPVTLTTLDGAEVDSPVAAQLVGPAWTFDMSPDASLGVAWTYHDGVWIQGVDGNRVLVDPSGMYPAWQPVPMEIQVPQ